MFNKNPVKEERVAAFDLTDAARRGDLDFVETALRHNPNLATAKDRNGHTLFHILQEKQKAERPAPVPPPHQVFDYDDSYSHQLRVYQAAAKKYEDDPRVKQYRYIFDIISVNVHERLLALNFNKQAELKLLSDSGANSHLVSFLSSGVSDARFEVNAKKWRLDLISRGYESFVANHMLFHKLPLQKTLETKRQNLQLQKNAYNNFANQAQKKLHNVIAQINICVEMKVWEKNITRSYDLMVQVKDAIAHAEKYPATDLHSAYKGAEELNNEMKTRYIECLEENVPLPLQKDLEKNKQSLEKTLNQYKQAAEEFEEKILVLDEQIKGIEMEDAKNAMSAKNAEKYKTHFDIQNIADRRKVRASFSAAPPPPTAAALRA